LIFYQLYVNVLIIVRYISILKEETKMKNISVLLILVLVIGLVAGCSPATETDDNAEQEETEGTDVVTTASVTDDKEIFKAALAADGTWIAAALTDFTFDEALVLEGTIDHEGTEERKIALYEQDEDRNITGEFTLKTPSLTVKTDNTRIKGGTVDGDLYVEGNTLQLQHVVVTGDVIFATEDVKASFTADEDTTIEGEMMVEGADVVTAASVTDDKGAFKAALAADGTWIAAALTDFTFDEALVLEGTIDHEGTEERKIALYEQDADRNITAEYTLKTPSLTVKTDNTRIKGGTIDGDLYVEGNTLQLQHVVVTGNVIFANEDVKASFTADEDTTIEGETSVE